MKRRSVRQFSNSFWKSSLVVLVLLSISCGGSSPNNSSTTAANLASIALTATAGPIEIGDSLQFTATGTYSDGTTRVITTNVSWSSANPAVAQVNGSGLVSALTAGSTSISASLEGVSASSTVSVDPSLNSLSVSPTTSALEIGDTIQLTATGTYSDSTSRNLTSSASWTTSDPKVASVDDAGVVSAIGAGLGSITVSIEGVSTSAAIRVWPSLSSINVTPTDPQVELHTTQHFTALGIYSDGSERDLTAIAEWNSENSSIATINQTGLADAIAPGTSVISATSQGIRGSSTLTVQSPHLVSLVVDQDAVTLPIGIPQQLTATGVFSDTETQAVHALSWNSSDPDVLSIDENGVAWTHSSGSVTITASCGSVVGTGTVTVSNVELTDLALAPEALSLPAGIQKQLILVGTFSDDTTRNLSAGIKWESSNPSVASVNQDGRVSSFSFGATIIKATLGELTFSAPVSVTEATLLSIAIDPNSATSPAGKEQSFTARGTYSDGTTEDISSVATWIFTDGSTATINNTGVAVGTHPGTVSVIAHISGIEGAASFEVTPVVLTGITIAPEDVAAPQGNYIQYKAAATYSDNSTVDVTPKVTWSSTVPEGIGIDNHGLAVAHKPGTATINAVLEEQSASSAVTVTSPGSEASEAATPVITSAGYFLTPTVTMSSSTPGVWIYYTDDGTTPTTASTLYTGPITLSTPTRLQAIAVGASYAPSGVASVWVTVGAATPTISPAGGIYATPPTVTITSSPGVSIHYTLDGTTPTAESTLYTGPFAISNTTTIKAIAVGEGYSQSLVGVSTITISDMKPE